MFPNKKGLRPLGLFTSDIKSMNDLFVPQADPSKGQLA